MKKLLLLLLVIFPLLFSCNNQPPVAETQDTNSSSIASYFTYNDTGVQAGGVRMIPVATPVGTFQVWTKRVGNNPGIKVLLLHGGPGSGHEYMEVFESFFPKEGFEFYEYDQLGASYSDQPEDSSLWTVDRYVDEVEQVRKALHLDKDNLYILGQSWGGILALEYALKYQDHIKGLIISNMVPSIPDYNQYATNVLAKGIEPHVLAEIKSLEEKKQYTNPRYQELLLPHFYKKHICRLDEWPEPLNRSFKHMNQEIYVMMQGPSEFGASGRLLNWDRKADLPKITVPTLTIGAKYDTMDPEQMKWMSTQVKNGSYLDCPNGSHLAMYDDQQTYMNGVIKWIKKVDSRNVSE